MVGGLIQLQQRLQEAENLIQKLEDQLQSLIDEENIPAPEEKAKASVQSGSHMYEPDDTAEVAQSRLYNSYGARYADVSDHSAYDTLETSLQVNSAAEIRDLSFCIGREGAFGAYTRPV